MNSLELFSGLGGLAKGLELSGFNHTTLVEYNKYAYASLCQNFEAKKVFFGDIRDFDLEQLDNTQFNLNKILKNLKLKN